MLINIPIYVEQTKPEAEGQRPSYEVRPIFRLWPTASDENYQQALAKLSKEIRRELAEDARKMRQNDFAASAFAPDFKEHFVTLNVALKAKRQPCRILLLVFERFDRRIVYAPALPDIFFDLELSETLETRAEEVLTRYFRAREKERTARSNQMVRPGLRPQPTTPEAASVEGRAWTSRVEIQIEPPLLGRTPVENLFAQLGGGDEALDGEWELEQVGRCLDELYPDDLNRAVGREREVEELTRRMQAKDRRAVLLVGPRLVGKTALIEEYVARKIERHESKYAARRRIWLLAPQRLISGMSYVGQWENRLHAILAEIKKKKHVLYLDDLLGLLRAGISASSNLSAAHVLKPYIERREIRVLAEITPEAFRVLRERDRGLADLFQPLRLEEPSETETIKMMLGFIRRLEQKHRCRFDFSVLPTVIDLQRRYVRDAAFPGKVAAALTQLAVKHPGESVTGFHVFADFGNRTGLHAWMLRDDWTLTRAQVRERLEASVQGQPEALAALADVVAIAKARLNDPDRPLGSLLFLGPTGVGKTQTAKALATLLFGDAERMIRFDMNEYVSPAAVAKLIGTFQQPEGLLTSAVRRQPFSVVLLDEIEKADPEVFNLLLQVMGDGRLTDAIGRTTDFTNAILILTSNLGVKEANSELGFATEQTGRQAEQASIYRQAAEKFFSPEFFNRLDRVIPFHRLSRVIVEQVARGLLRAVFQRDGLTARRTILRVDDRAFAQIVDAGFHPQLGARALKREIEKQLVQPVAAQIAAFPPSAPTVIDVLPGTPALRIHAQPLVEAAPRPNEIERLLDDPHTVLARVDEFLAALSAEMDAMQPTGAISTDAIDYRHRRYFAAREQQRRVTHLADRLRGQLDYAARATTRLTRRRAPQPRLRGRKEPNNEPPSRSFWREAFAAEDIQEYFAELVATPQNDEQKQREQIAELAREAAWLGALARNEDADFAPLLVLSAATLRDGTWAAHPQLIAAYRDTFARFGFELESEEETDRALMQACEARRIERHRMPTSASLLLVRGCPHSLLARAEAGIHLFVYANGEINPLRLDVLPLSSALEVSQAAAIFADRVLSTEPNEAALPPVLRLYKHPAPGESGDVPAVDLRSGLATPDSIFSKYLRTHVLAALQLPEELQHEKDALAGEAGNPSFAREVD